MSLEGKIDNNENEKAVTEPTEEKIETHSPDPIIKETQESRGQQIELLRKEAGAKTAPETTAKEKEYNEYLEKVEAAKKKITELVHFFRTNMQLYDKMDTKVDFQQKLGETKLLTGIFKRDLLEKTMTRGSFEELCRSYRIVTKDPNEKNPLANTGMKMTLGELLDKFEEVAE
jgi:hypothetical protein